MIRAIALAARLDFTIEPALLDAIRAHRHEIAKSSPPRLLEEYYKILRAGSSEKAFRGLAKSGCCEPISAELHHGAAEPLWQVARRRSTRTAGGSSRRPDTLTNAILLGSLLVPLGISLHPPRGAGTSRRARSTSADAAIEGQRRPPDRRPRAPARGSASCRWRAATSSGCGRSSACSGGCATSPRARARSAR